MSLTEKDFRAAVRKACAGKPKQTKMLLISTAWQVAQKASQMSSPLITLKHLETVMTQISSKRKAAANATNATKFSDIQDSTTAENTMLPQIAQNRGRVDSRLKTVKSTLSKILG